MKPSAGLALLSAVAVTALGASTTMSLASAVKLPKRLTTPTGNAITLYAYDAPTSKSAVASAQVQVCTSAHTPKGSGVDPAFFALKLTNGKTVSLSPHAAHKPALVLQALAASQCSVKGWISFDVPTGDHVAALDYSYHGTISWSLG
jgi:hypothetical protein